MIERMNANAELEVDGGIDAVTAPLVAAFGANVFVAGSSVFGDDAGVTPAMENLRASIQSSVPHLVPALASDHAFKETREA